MAEGRGKRVGGHENTCRGVIYKRGAYCLGDEVGV